MRRTPLTTLARARTGTGIGSLPPHDPPHGHLRPFTLPDWQGLAWAQTAAIPSYSPLLTRTRTYTPTHMD